MSQPLAIRSKDIAVFADSVQLRRVQKLTVDGNLSTEDIMELANADYVEQAPNIPVISISLESNDVGSTVTLATLCNLLDTDPDANEADANENTISLSNVDAGLSNMIIPVTENGTLTARSLLARGLVVNSMNFTFDTNGITKESIELGGYNLVWLGGDTNKSAKLAKGTFIDATTFHVHKTYNTTTTLLNGYVDTTTFNEHPIKNAAGAYICFVNGKETEIATTTIDTTYANAPDWRSGVITLKAGSPALVAGDVIVVVYITGTYATATFTAVHTYPALTTGASTSGVLGAVFGGAVDAFIYVSDTEDLTPAAADKLLRCQTVNLSVDMQREVLTQLGDPEPYARMSRFPVPVTIKADFNESDLTVFAKMIGTTVASLTYGDIKEFVKNSNLLINIYKDKYVKDNTTLVKQISITKMNVTSLTDDGNVGTLVTNGMEFKASNMKIVGKAVDPYNPAA